MTDYLSQSIFQPSIPTNLITDEDRRFFEAFSISIDPDGDDKVYLYAEDWCTAGVLPGEDPKDDIELSEDDLYDRFQEIIRRSNGDLPGFSRKAPIRVPGCGLTVTAAVRFSLPLMTCSFAVRHPGWSCENTRQKPEKSARKRMTRIFLC